MITIKSPRYHDRKVLLTTLQQADEAKKKRLKEMEEESRMKAQSARSRGKSGKRRR